MSDLVFMNLFNIFIICVGGGAGVCVWWWSGSISPYLDTERFCSTSTLLSADPLCSVTQHFDPFCQSKSFQRVTLRVDVEFFCAHSAGCALTGGNERQ